tara:strand:+ start:4561 stop:4866 length:306 start_codon:yes stop_codon:yes gene_type:complete
LKLSLLSDQFSFIMNQKNQIKCSGVLFYYVLSKKPSIGFAINKKLGNAVLRNRFKRQSRSLFVSKKKLGELSVVVRPVVPLGGIKNLSLCFDKLCESVSNA